MQSQNETIKQQKKIKIKIDGQNISCLEGDSVLKVAQDNDIFIPNLCHHPDLPTKANCRVCVVEIKGRNGVHTSCSTKAIDGMEIFTTTDKVKRTRNTNIELIFAEHIEKCADCTYRFNCSLLDYAEKYKILITRFKDRKGKRKTYKFANAVEIDGTQCIDCRNCVDVCSLVQDINYLEIAGKGVDQEIRPVKDKSIDCIYCGQCTLHCPVAAAQEQYNWPEVQKALKDKKKLVIAQIAPSIRVSIGEEFGLDPGQDVTGKTVAALRELGFDYVFDVNFGADITTMIEAEELLERVKDGGKLPMMSSCCPAWVKYVEFYRPDLIPNLTTSRSPQIHNAGVIKTYWANKMSVDPRDIMVVSIMPCTAKKFESSREEMYLKGQKLVDHVLITRELAFLLKKNNIDLLTLESSKADDPMGEHSGAGAIYGASGGVMESALRTAQHLAGCEDGLECSRLDYEEVRGLDGVKEAKVDVAGTKLNVAVVNGIGNVKKVLDNLEKYHYIEIMACPGGCIGGGGQPIPTTMEIVEKRRQAIYKIDKEKKIRKAHENQNVLNIIRWTKEQGVDFSNNIFYTKYKKRKI